MPIWPGGAKGRQPAPGASWSPRRPASCKCKLRRSTVSAAIARRFRMYGGRPRLALEEVQKLVMGNAELVGARSLRSTRVPSQFRESQEDDGRQPSITIGQLALRGVISNMRTKLVADARLRQHPDLRGQPSGAGGGPGRTQPPQLPTGLTLKGQAANQVQQPHRTEPTASDPHRPTDLRQRPSVTFLPLDGKEKVGGDALARPVWRPRR